MDKNQLYYGDNLDVLRRYIKDESVDLIYLDPPFNSRQDYNVLFAEKDGTRSSSQIKAATHIKLSRTQLLGATMRGMRARIFFCLLVIAPSLFAQDLTTIIAASKLQVLNAAYISAAPEDWHPAAVNVPLGTMWFGLQAGAHENAYDCGLVVRENGGSSALIIRLFERDGHLKEKDRAKIAEHVLSAIRKRLGRGEALHEDTVIDVPDPFRRIIRGLPPDVIFQSAIKDRGLWVLATLDPAERRAIFLSPRPASGADADVLLLHVVDLDNTEVRMDFGFRTTAGGTTHMNRDVQSGLLRHFVELVLMDLKGPLYPGAATR